MSEHPAEFAGDVDMTPEQLAEFKARFAEAMERPFSYKVLPPRFLTEDQVRQLLAECVTVVKPGETLVLRMGREWTPNQMREVQDSLDAAVEWKGLPFKAIVVPADDLGVVEAENPGA